VTIGGISDPALVERTYKDIDAIFKSNPDNYKVHEERYPDGKFKQFTVET